MSSHDVLVESRWRPSEASTAHGRCTDSATFEPFVDCLRQTSLVEFVHAVSLVSASDSPRCPPGLAHAVVRTRLQVAEFVASLAVETACHPATWARIVNGHSKQDIHKIL